MLRVLQRPGRLVRDRGHLAVHVEQLALVEAEAFDDVLEGVGVHRLLERLAQQILPAFRIGQMAVDRQHDVVGDEAFGRGEEAEIALDRRAARPRSGRRATSTARYRPAWKLRSASSDCCSREIFLPRPFVFQRQQLIDVGAAIDHPLVVDGDAAAAAVDGAEAGRVGGRERRRGATAGGVRRAGAAWFGPVEHVCYSFSVAHWQASHSGLSIEQATAPDKSAQLPTSTRDRGDGIELAVGALQASTSRHGWRCASANNTSSSIRAARPADRARRASCRRGWRYRG